jgi:hypothetical protein
VLEVGFAARQAHRIVPIDRCYALVGLIRTHWHGIAGGEEAWDTISVFFSDLRGSPNDLGVQRHG